MIPPCSDTHGRDRSGCPIEEPEQLCGVRPTPDSGLISIPSAFYHIFLDL